jgi:hypothetical protein
MVENLVAVNKLQLSRLILPIRMSICRHDMFNVRLSYAAVGQNRRYTLHRTYPGHVGSAVEQGRYLGPSLRLILDTTDEEQSKLAVLEVPGLPEVSMPKPLQIASHPFLLVLSPKLCMLSCAVPGGEAQHSSEMP